MCRQQSGLEIAVRGGGHGVAGHGVVDDGLVVDLRRMNGVQIDPDARIARVGGGATWGDFDRACRFYWLGTTGGRVSTTGVAGLTLGGGSGWLERKFGLTCDSLVSVELVTADGRLLIADETKNPELFWALHGGGGNFGVATALTFRLQRLPVTTLALLFWSMDAGPAVFRAYRDLIEQRAPDELGGAAVYLTGPPEEFVPEQLRGTLIAGVVAVYAGDEAEARDVLAPLLHWLRRGRWSRRCRISSCSRRWTIRPGFAITGPPSICRRCPIRRCRRSASGLRTCRRRHRRSS